MAYQGWNSVAQSAQPYHVDALVDQIVLRLAGLPFGVLRNRRALRVHAERALSEALPEVGVYNLDEVTRDRVISLAIARAGGLGFLDALLPPNAEGWQDIVMNGDGTVFARGRQTAGKWEQLSIRPSIDEAWRAVEGLLAPTGRACTEATPTVDAKLPRDPEINFGGARIKITHPVITPGLGYPSISIRLYEPRPVPPHQVVEWGAVPKAVMDALLEAVASRLRVLVFGGTSSGKTTLLSALCHGIPADERVVTIEDPQEIWIPHVNQVTLEPRHAPPGSDVTDYTVANAVDDAMRMAPTWLIVGEVRHGDAALALFRALMSDHPGLSTFHAESVDEAVERMALLMYADAGVQPEAARKIIRAALDVFIQVTRDRDGRRRVTGVWEVNDNGGFRLLWKPGQTQMEKITRKRG